MSELIKQNFELAKSTPSDINEHIDTLYNLAKECSSICEMGVRNVVSTWAFMLRDPEKLIGIDLHTNDNVLIAQEAYPKWQFIQADTTKITIEETDLLFLDTLHTGSQIKKELELHANKVRKYIVFHDVETYGYKPEPTDWQTPEIMENYKHNDTGIMPPILDFLNANKKWTIHAHYNNNNGLLVIKRNGNI